MPLDMDYVRRQFPALQKDDTIYFDNAGGSVCLQNVAQLIQDYLLHYSVQHGATYKKSQQAKDRLIQAQQAVAQLINAERYEECIMGPSTTLLIRALASSLGQIFKPGDEVIVTDSDHEANIGGWYTLEHLGITIKVWPLNPESLALDLNQLKSLITDRTKLVCLTHISNVLGTLNPIQSITEFAHSHGIKVCVDGVAYAPHRIVDVQAWDVDYYVFSFYKVYGPHHAVLYGKYEDLLNLPSINHYFISEDHIPYKFQPGNVNYELSYGCIGIVDYLTELGKQAGCTSVNTRDLLTAAFDGIAEQEQTLSKRLLDYLNARSDIQVIGHSEPDKTLRVPTISFIVDGKDSEEIVTQIDQYDIGIRFGDFYSKRLIESLNLVKQNGVVRVSMVHYNTLEEVDRLTTHLDQILG